MNLSESMPSDNLPRDHLRTSKALEKPIFYQGAKQLAYKQFEVLKGHTLTPLTVYGLCLHIHSISLNPETRNSS